MNFGVFVNLTLFSNIPFLIPKKGVRPRPSSGKQKYSDSRRDSAEFNLERQIASPVVRFHQIQETRRKLSQSKPRAPKIAFLSIRSYFLNCWKEKKATSGSSFSSNIFDIVLTSTRPDQKTIEYFQNRPRRDWESLYWNLSWDELSWAQRLKNVPLNGSA